MPTPINSSFVRRPGITVLPCVAAGVLACAYLGSPTRASADLSFEDKPSTPNPSGADGFTRENSTDLAPGMGKTAPPVGPPTPATPPPVVAHTHVRRQSQPRLEDNSKEGPKDFASTHHQGAHVASTSSQPRRNPAESFVYYWNGFVMKTFHTRRGTLFLNKVGAKS